MNPNKIYKTVEEVVTHWNTEFPKRNDGTPESSYELAKLRKDLIYAIMGLGYSQAYAKKQLKWS